MSVIDKTGLCGIQIRFNNNKSFPNTSISDFCLEVEPSGLNRLGKLFRVFSKLDTTQLLWNESDGEVV